MKVKGIELDSIQWSQPLSLKKWCLIFGYDYKKSRNKLARAFKDPKRIRAKRFSSREWRVHIDDLPAEYALRILFSKSLEELRIEMENANNKQAELGQVC